MILRNWYKALTALMYNDDSVIGVDINGSNKKFKGSNGTNGIYDIPLTMVSNSSLSGNIYTPNMGIVRTDTYNGGVIFGTGDTAPTFDDYKLSGSMITTITASAAASAVQDNDGCTFVGTYTITNTGDEEITIKEIGLLLNSKHGYRHLIERTVLDTSVTIPVGGVGQVTYTIRMDYPT